MQHWATFELAAYGAGEQASFLRVDHHGRTRGRELPHLTRADRHERVGAAPVAVERSFLVGHLGDPLGHLLDRGDHGHALGGRELALQPEASFVVHPPPAEGPLGMGLPVDLDLRVRVALGAAAHRSARHPPGPADQPCLIPGRREPGELHDLVEPELTRPKRVADPGKDRQRPGGLYPAVRLPQRDPIADLEPVGEVPGPVVASGLGGPDRSDRPEHLELGGTHPGVRPVQVAHGVASTDVPAFEAMAPSSEVP